jgi:hydroxypyruvate reductase
MPGTRTINQMRSDAQRIWQAGLAAVNAERLLQEFVRVEGAWLYLGDEAVALDRIRHIEVVGGGKAGAGMAAGLEAALGPRVLAEKHVSGWLNVPADCVRPLKAIHLHAARPAGVNEPTEAGVAGTAEILRRVAALGPDDLCLCLISGGGSALMPAPVAGLELSGKLAVTRFLSAAGATIEELNAVRKQLSEFKGGGLARSCRAGQLVSLILSDVLGDPLDTIASGPTVASTATRREALAVLDQYAAARGHIPAAVFACLESEASALPPPTCKVRNAVIGNNAVAVDAAGLEAERLGYSHAMIAARASEGLAEDVGRHLAEVALRMRREPGPDCLISGGEPVVRLAASSIRGRGGRNQQLVLAAVEVLLPHRPAGVVLLSGGTDGEDGPTDAAGAWLDDDVLAAVRKPDLDPADFLARNDAYTFFNATGGLLKTGPTHTNVCDLRVVLVDRVELSSDRRRATPQA